MRQQASLIRFPPGTPEFSYIFNTSRIFSDHAVEHGDIRAEFSTAKGSTL